MVTKLIKVGRNVVAVFTIDEKGKIDNYFSNPNEKIMVDTITEEQMKFLGTVDGYLLEIGGEFGLEETYPKDQLKKALGGLFDV